MNKCFLIFLELKEVRSEKDSLDILMEDGYICAVLVA